MLLQRSKPWRKKLFLQIRQKRQRVFLLVCLVLEGLYLFQAQLPLAQVTRREAQQQILPDHQGVDLEIYGLRIRWQQGQLELFYEKDQLDPIMKEAE